MFSTALRAAVLGLGLVVVAAPVAFAEGDPAKGKKVFRKCQACHVVGKEQNRVGPHLTGVIGRAAGGVDGFKYSKAMAGSDVTWTEENLDAYLENPKKFLKGTRMAFPGLKKAQDRADVIAYIRDASN